VIIQEFSKGATNTILITRPRASELECRNVGAEMSKGDVLLFLSADVLLPPNTLEKIARDFESNQNLIGVTGLPLPFEATQMLRLEYSVWNGLKTLSAHLPRPLKTFITSSSFMAVKKDRFLLLEGFDTNNVNADGAIGAKLISMGDALFDTTLPYFLSGRRYNKVGMLGFNRQFLYNAVEDFFPPISRLRGLDGFRRIIRGSHGSVT